MAEWRDLPLATQAFESAEDVQLSQFNAAMVDFIPVKIEEKIHLMKRYGLVEYLDLGTNAPVDGLYWFDRGRVTLAVSGGRVFKISDASGTVMELFGSTAMQSNAPVNFASDATRVIMANGGRMVHTDLATLTTMADGDAPTSVSHVVSMDQYVLANSIGSGTIQFSAINDLTNWTALEFFTAESKYDDVVAIREGYREIIALGRESVEFWVNDGQNPFSRIPGSAQPFGTDAAQSLALVGDTWIWLDHTRRLATMNGRQVVNMSTPYDRVIQEMSSVNDAIGYAISFDGQPLYVLNFPTARQTLVYNYMSGQWHKWGYWDLSNGRYERFRGMSYAYARSWNLHLFGDHTNGKIYRMSRTAYTDNGNPIRSMVRTGNVDHGTYMNKRSDLVRVRCSRGGDANVANPQLRMRRRVNDSAQWENERSKPLGPVGNRYPFIDFRRNGVYKTCQYEFVHSDDSPLIMIGAQEYVVPLGT